MQTITISTINTKKQISATDVEKICNIDFLEKTAELTNRAFFDETYNHLKIKDLKNAKNFNSQIGFFLTKIATMSGIKNPIDNFTKQDIIRLIIRRYSLLSVAEIYKAFENERYGINQNKTEHFQLFDSNYISAVIDKYIDWRQNEKIKSNWLPPQNQEVFLLPEISDKEKHEQMTKEINRLITTYLLQGHLDNEVIVHVYQELCDRNIILRKSDDPEMQKRLDNYFQKQYDKAQEQVLSELKQKARQSNYYRQVLDDVQNNKSGAVITQMQRNILCQLFEKNRNNKDFVNRINN